MISEEKTGPALWALNAVLVAVRHMAYTGRGHEEIGDALDVAEVLPTYFIRPDDLTLTFRETLVDLQQRFPDTGFGPALQRFDEDQCPW